MFRRLVVISLKGLLDTQRSRRQGKRRLTGTGGVLALIALVMVLLIVSFRQSFFGPMFEILYGTPLYSLYFVLASFAAVAVAVVFVLFMTGPALYAAKDNERLLAMPIRPHVIVLARLTGLYVYSLFSVSLLMIPAIATAILDGSMSLGQLALAVLVTLLLPLFALTVSLLIGLLLHLLSQYLVRLKTVITLVISIVFLGFYFYAVTVLQLEIQKLLAQGQAIQEAIREIAPFFYHAGAAIVHSSFASFWVFMVWALLPFVVVVLLIERLFLAIVRRVPRVKHVAFKGVHASGKSKTGALISREVKHYLAAPMVILNTMLGSFLALAGAIALIIDRGRLVDILGVEALQPFLPHGFLLIILFFIVTGPISASSLSLEGNTFWHLKTLPVVATQVLLAKVGFHYLAVAPFFLLLSLSTSYVWQASVWQAVTQILIPQAFIVVFALIGILINLRFPRFDYANETQVVKQSLSVMLTMLLGVVLVVILVAGYAWQLHRILSLDAYAGVVIAFLLTLAIVLLRMVATYGVRRFNQL